MNLIINYGDRQWAWGRDMTNLHQAKYQMLAHKLREEVSSSVIRVDSVNPVSDMFHTSIIQN